MTGVSAIVPAVLVTAACGVTAGGLAPWLLRRAVEPDLDLDEVKIPYSSLASGRIAGATGLWAAALAAVSLMTVEPERVAPWLVVAIIGALCSVVDIATTWIPRRWLRMGWLLTGATVAVCAWSVGDWPGVGRAVIGAAIVGGVFAIVYGIAQLTSHSIFGFADVRLGILVGLAAGWRSISTATTGLVLGAFVGALWGVLVAIRRGARSAFAYGPSIVLGPYLALAVTALTGR